MTKIESFDDLYARLKMVKNNYINDSINVSVQQFGILIMSGAFDSLFPDVDKIRIEDRFEVINNIKKCMGSKAGLKERHKNDGSYHIDLPDISCEYERNLWLKRINPLHLNSISTCFKEVLKIMGFFETDNINIPFKKHTNSRKIDVISDLKTALSDDAINYYGHRTCDRKSAVIVIYRGYETIKYGNEGKEFKKISVIDTSVSKEFKATIWPSRVTSDYDNGLMVKLKSLGGKPIMLVGSPSKSKDGKYVNFTIDEMIPVSY